MARRFSRIALVLVGILITSGLGYGALQDELALDQVRGDSAAVDRMAEDAALALSDLRAALHAYTAPGQGVAFWSTRATALLDSLRDRLSGLDTAIRVSGGAPPLWLEGVDGLAAAEKRARTYAVRGESLLAGEVIFAEIRDLLAVTEEQVITARAAFGESSARRLSERRLEQAGFIGGIVAMWVGIALVLLPGVNRAQSGDREWRQELAERLKAPVGVAPNTDATQRAAAETAPVREAPPAESVEPTITVAALKNVGAICADLSTLSDVSALNGALERACTVLDASGVIVWVASDDGCSLSPVASHGFDPRLVARIGNIARESSNLTAAAFRDNTARVSPATATAASALAVTLCGPSGPVGVLSAELRSGRTADDASVALAAIFAAQLATLAAPAAETGHHERSRSAAL